MFLDLSVVKKQLNKTDTSDDQSLTDYIGAAAAVIERHTGQTPTPTNYTDQLTISDSTNLIQVNHQPVTAINTITVNGDSVDVATVQFRQSGLIQLTDPVCGWVDVSYLAGYSQVPANFELAGMIIVQHLWETRRGNMPTVSTSLDGGDMGIPRTAYGFAIPRKALELLGAESPLGFA